MKKKYFLILLLGTILLSLAFSKNTDNSFPLFGKLIILDPGHGNVDPGSIYKDKYEKDYNLTFALSLKTELEKIGATVILTREGDYDLSNPNVERRKRSDFNNRIKLINESDADMYISLHMNSLNNTKYYGAQVFYDDVHPSNETIAKMMQQNLNYFFNLKREYNKIDNSKYMFKKINVKGVLIEYGFISNYKDRKNLESENYRSRLSKVICNTLVQYFT